MYLPLEALLGITKYQGNLAKLTGRSACLTKGGLPSSGKLPKNTGRQEKRPSIRRGLLWLARFGSMQNMLTETLSSTLGQLRVIIDDTPAWAA